MALRVLLMNSFWAGGYWALVVVEVLIVEQKCEREFSFSPPVRQSATPPLRHSATPPSLVKRKTTVQTNEITVV